MCLYLSVCVLHIEGAFVHHHSCALVCYIRSVPWEVDDNCVVVCVHHLWARIIRWWRKKTLLVCCEERGAQWLSSNQTFGDLGSCAQEHGSREVAGPYQSFGQHRSLGHREQRRQRLKVYLSILNKHSKSFINQKEGEKAALRWHHLTVLFAGRVPPVHRGVVAAREDVRLHLVQPAGCQEEILQEAREENVAGRREEM